MKNKRKKTILYITPSTNVKGGISTVISSYFNANLLKKYKLKKIATNIDGPKLIKLIVAIVGLVRVAIIMIFRNIDIVHIHAGDVISCKRKFYYFKLIKNFRSKIIFHFHGALFMDCFPNLTEIWKNRISEMFMSVDSFICISESWKRQILGIVPKASITVIHNSVDLPNNIEKIYSSKTIIQITFLGLIGQRKGIFDLLEVFKRLINRGYMVHINIGGNGDIGRLRREIQNKNLGTHVSYLGWLTGKEKEILLRRTDILVLPSYGEGMPMTILEAMSYGIAVISTNVGGIPEIITSEKEGFLLSPGDLNGLQRKIIILYKNKKLRDEMGKAARKKVERFHNIDKIVKQLDAIYKEMLL